MKEKTGHTILNSNKNNIKIVIHNETKKKKRKRAKKKDKDTNHHHAQIGQPVQPQGQAVVTADGTVVNVGRGQSVGSSVDNHRQLALNYLAPVPPVAPQLQIANAPAVVVNPLNRQALPPPAPARSPMRVVPPKQKQKKQQVHQLNKIGLMKVKTLKELKEIMLAYDPSIPPDLINQLTTKNKSQAIDMFLDGSSSNSSSVPSVPIGGGVSARPMRAGEFGGGGGVDSATASRKRENDREDERLKKLFSSKTKTAPFVPFKGHIPSDDEDEDFNLPSQLQSLSPKKTPVKNFMSHTTSSASASKFLGKSHAEQLAIDNAFIRRSQEQKKQRADEIPAPSPPGGGGVFENQGASHSNALNRDFIEPVIFSGFQEPVQQTNQKLAMRTSKLAHSRPVKSPNPNPHRFTDPSPEKGAKVLEAVQKISSAEKARGAAAFVPVPHPVPHPATIRHSRIPVAKVNSAPKEEDISDLHEGLVFG